MRNRYVIAVLAGGLLLAGCGASRSSSPAVPSLSQAAGQRGDDVPVSHLNLPNRPTAGRLGPVVCTSR